MKIRILLAGAAAALIVGMVPSPASAQVDGAGFDAPVSADITANGIGFRAVTAAAVAPISSSLSALTLSGAYTAAVTETLRSGTNNWSVTASLAGDLSTVGGDTIDEQYVSVTGRSFTRTLSGGTASAPSGSSALGDGTGSGQSVTLGSSTGQLTNTLYSGSYAAAGTLTIAPPAGTKTGLYSGTFQVDLVQ